MKIPGYFFLMLILLALSVGCNREKETQLLTWLPGDMLQGKVSAQRETDGWLASGQGRYNTPEANYFYFQGWTVDKANIIKESLFLEPISLIPGKYVMANKPVLYELNGIVNANFALVDFDITEAYCSQLKSGHLFHHNCVSCRAQRSIWGRRPLFKKQMRPAAPDASLRSA